MSLVRKQPSPIPARRRDQGRDILRENGALLFKRKAVDVFVQAQAYTILSYRGMQKDYPALTVPDNLFLYSF
jgi:hypothetical protein